MADNMRREDWLKVLAADDNPDSRNVFADWLEEQGEHEEAEQQRKHAASMTWLRNWLSKRHTPSCKKKCDHVDYKTLILRCAGALQNPLRTVRGGADPDLTSDVGTADSEFWRHLSVVTGIPGVDEEPEVEPEYDGCAGCYN